MRRRIAGVLVGALALLPAASAGAALLAVKVTIAMQLGFETQLPMATVTGKATVNASAGGSHLVTLKLHPTWIRSISPRLDPVDLTPILSLPNPEISASIVSLRLLDAEIKGGTLYSPTQDTMALAGVARVCLFVAGCGQFLDIPFTENGTRGIGLGGVITAKTASSSRTFSLVNAPWQLATATLEQQTPTSGNLTALTHKGYAHGPVSTLATSTTALTGGVIQLVSPTQLHNTGIGVGNHDTIALFTTLTVTFLPEPGLLLMLGSGVVGLALIGRSRIRS